MGVMGMFGGKESGTVAEEGEMGPGMVNMLAGMPGVMRKQMMKGRINQLFTLSEEKRQDTIRGMFGSFHHTTLWYALPRRSQSRALAVTRQEPIGRVGRRLTVPSYDPLAEQRAPGSALGPGYAALRRDRLRERGRRARSEQERNRHCGC